MVIVRIATLYLLLWLTRVLAHCFMMHAVFTPESCDEENRPQSDDLSSLTLLMSGGAGIRIRICLLFLFTFLTIRVSIRVGFHSTRSFSHLTFGAG